MSTGRIDELIGVNRDGTPSHRAKGTPWKGSFHLPRTRLPCWRRLEKMKREGPGLPP